MSQLNRAIVIMMSQIRSKQLFIFFNLPSIFDLDRNLSLFRANILLHVYCDQFGRRGKYMLFGEDRLKTLYLLGKKYYNYNRPRCNLLARFPKRFVLDFDKYARKKQQAIQSLELKREAGGVVGMRYKTQRNLLIRHLCNQENYSHKELAELISDSKFKLSARAVGNIVNK